MKVIVFVTSPSETFVTDPVARISLTSPSTNPSPVTVTCGLVNAVPSYGLLAPSLVNVTLRGLIVSCPETVLTTTLSVTSTPSFTTFAVPSKTVFEYT